MPAESKLTNLVLFLKSTISPIQIGQLIELLKEGMSAPETLDPELAPKARKPVAQVEAPAGIEDILKEIETAYSETQFPAPSPDESRRVRDSYPGFIEKLSAYQGRHLLKMLREKLKI